MTKVRQHIFQELHNLEVITTKTTTDGYEYMLFAIHYMTVSSYFRWQQHRKFQRNIDLPYNQLIYFDFP